MANDVHIVAINLGLRIGLLDDDTSFAITALLDDDGDETDDPDEAASAVGRLNNGLWVSFPISDFNPAESLH